MASVPAAGNWTVRDRRSIWVPVALFIVLSALILHLWSLGQRYQEFTVRFRCEVAADQVASRLEDYFDTRIDLLRHLAWRWNEGQLREREAFAREAERIQDTFAGFQAVNFVDADGVIRWVTPEGPNLAARGRNLRDHPEAAPTFAEAERLGDMRMTPPAHLFQGGRGLAIYIPLTRSGVVEGYLNGVLRIEPAVEACTRSGLNDRFFYRIRDGEHTVVSFVGDSDAFGNGRDRGTARVPVGTRTWEIVMEPRPEFVRHSETVSNEIIAGVALALAAVLCWAVWLMLSRQQRLLSSEQRSRLLVESINDGIVISQDDRLTFVNPRFAEMLGCEAEELVGAHYTRVFPPEAEEILRDREQRRERGEDPPARYETVIRRRDGVDVPVEANVSIIGYHGGLATFGVIRDITDRREAETILRKREEYIGALAETNSLLLPARDVSAVLPRVLERLHSVSGASVAALYMIDRAEDGSLYACRRYASPPVPGSAGSIAPDRIALSEDDARRWMRRFDSGEVVHGAADSLTPEDRAIFLPDGAVETVVAPVRHRSGSIGWLQLTTDDPDAEWGEQEERLASAAAASIESAVERAEAEHIDIGLSQLALRLPGARTLEEVLEVAREESSRLLHWDAYLLAVRSVDGSKYHEVDRVDTIDGRPQRFTPDSPRETVFSDAIRPVLRGRPILLNRDAGSEDPPVDLDRFGREDRRSASLAYVPVRSGGLVLGILSAQSYTPMRYGDYHLTVLQRIADALSPAIERTRAEEARIRLTAAVEQAAEAIMVTDPHGVIQYVNPGFESITGFTAAEAVGSTPRLLRSGEHDDAFYRGIWETLARGEVWKGRITNRRRDGSLACEECTISPVRGPGGGIINYVSVARDVTQELEVEAQRRQSQKLEAIGTLAGGIAHDFNNLLTGILGHASLLRLGASPGDRVHEAALVIEKAAERAAQLTSQLLGFARGGKHLNVPVDFHQTIREAESLLARTIDKRIRIERDFQAPSAWVRGDPTQMQQVMINLALNARDAMPDGGVLTFGTREADDPPPGIHPNGSDPSGPWVVVTVSDTGAGIPPGLHDRIFDPFFTTKEPGKGTGMGLAMVYGILRNHHGAIGVTSETGHGSTFHVALPALAEGPRAAAEEASAADGDAAGTNGGGRILVVDDESVVRHVASRMLQRLGYEVVTADGGAEALERYRGDGASIDVVLLDVAMPGMDGIEVFRALRDIDPDVRTVLSTGYSVDRTIEEILDKGMAGFVQKPYRASQLADAIASALARQAETR